MRSRWYVFPGGGRHVKREGNQTNGRKEIILLMREAKKLPRQRWRSSKLHQKHNNYVGSRLDALLNKVILFIMEVRRIYIYVCLEAGDESVCNKSGKREMERYGKGAEK